MEEKKSDDAVKNKEFNLTEELRNEINKERAINESNGLRRSIKRSWIMSIVVILVIIMVVLGIGLFGAIQVSSSDGTKICDLGISGVLCWLWHGETTTNNAIINDNQALG